MKNSNTELIQENDSLKSQISEKDGLIDRLQEEVKKLTPKSETKETIEDPKKEPENSDSGEKVDEVKGNKNPFK